MPVVELPKCPKCETKVTFRHCKSPTCPWFRCFKCGPKPIDYLVFNTKNSFLTRRDR